LQKDKGKMPVLQKITSFRDDGSSWKDNYMRLTLLLALLIGFGVGCDKEIREAKAPLEKPAVAEAR
jgi:hypothetical protein